MRTGTCEAEQGSECGPVALVVDTVHLALPGQHHAGPHTLALPVAVIPDTTQTSKEMDEDKDSSNQIGK